jgi:predicted DsbA family dithiol-disulfide isomerase
MTLKIKVFYDFICPFCFLAEAPLYEAIKEKDVEVEWMPFELRPSPAPQIDPWKDPSKLKGWETFIIPTAKKWGIKIKLPRISPHPYTYLAHEGYQYAKEHGKGNDYHNRVIRAFFQEEKNIGEVDVLTKLAGEIGLDEGDFKESLVTRKYKEAHQKALRHAEEAQIIAVPTFLIGEEKIQGTVSKEILEKAIDQELQKIEYKHSSYGSGN